MMLPSFSDFFRSVWGYEPYPWQTKLAERVQGEGWPEVLDLPTGTGKTAVLDIALHHFIVDGGRTAPRRIVLVVDRRVIVDQVGVRARALLDAVSRPSCAVTRAIGDALRDLVGDDVPLLESAVLRGATVQNDAWASYPHVPVLAASTVDQVGSRLFFRGYGVGDRMKPIHAGLLGCDTLLFLDEVHLSRPFADVLDQLDQLRGPEQEIPRKFGVVQLSATPGTPKVSGVLRHSPQDESVGRGAFRLAQEDRRNERLARILGASKPAELDQVRTSIRGDDLTKRETVAKRAAHHARKMVAEGRYAVAVVVNRVDTARRVWAHLQDEAFDCELVTGRMRPLDQEAVVGRVEERVRAGSTVDPEAHPLVLVATQCIEAGADYDFDGLVTECASLDALRQRFGRLDRRGTCVQRIGRDSRAVILARSDIGKVDDPVYGESLPRTWGWLQSITEGGVVDFGIDALQQHLDRAEDDMDEMLAPNRPSPVLLPAYLDQWAQTTPRPFADPDVGLFLHGIPEDARSALPDVQVVWRADVTSEDIGAAASDARRLQDLVERIAIVPPGSLEALSLPIWSVKRWLSAVDEAAQDTDVADVEGVVADTAGDLDEPRDVLVWRGKSDSKVLSIQDVKPGSLIVVSADVGGLGPHRTFDPEVGGDAGPVPDFGDRVQLQQRGRYTLRFDERVYGPHLGEDARAFAQITEDEQADEIAILQRVLQTLRDLDGVPEWLANILEGLGSRPRFVLVALPATGQQAEERRWTALGRAPRPTPGRYPAGTYGDQTTGAGEEEDESFTGDASSLERHLKGVALFAKEFGERARLPESVSRSLHWSGMLHDVGKADPRFQLMLHGGDVISARFADGLLAKSDIPWQDSSARRRGREMARYPRGQRHELVSLDLIEHCQELRERIERDGADWDLVLYLVGTHHGWCRPLAPVVELAGGAGDVVEWTGFGFELVGTTAHGRSRLDSGVSERFWRLLRRYGRHELALLEAILRLSDHRRSALEQGN